MVMSCAYPLLRQARHSQKWTVKKINTQALNAVEHEENPWPHLRDQINFKYKKHDSIILECKLCLPKKKVEIATYKNCFQTSQACAGK